MTPRPYPWYSIENGASIDQGDIALNCPVIEPINTEQESESGNIEIEAERILGDMIIMSQACDLAYEKIDNVVLCPIWPISKFVVRWDEMKIALEETASRTGQKIPDEGDPAFVQTVNSLIGKCKRVVKQLEDIRKGEWPAYHVINQCPEVSQEVSVVDFHRIYSVPKVVLARILEKQGKRARLLPPYREHLAQSFARYFMRVGLPIDIPPFKVAS